MSGQEVVLIRHGQTEWSASGQHTGRTDIPLTDLGRRQADALGEMLRGTDFELILASPLSRAWETMERSGVGGEPIATDDLLEWDYGVYEGRRTEEIRREIPDWSVWTHPMVDGESLEQIGARADRVIARVLKAEGPVAMFAHGHMLRILAVRWIELAPVHGRNFSLDTATVSTLGWKRENRALLQWNEACHHCSLDPVL